MLSFGWEVGEGVSSSVESLDPPGAQVTLQALDTLVLRTNPFTREGRVWYCAITRVVLVEL